MDKTGLFETMGLEGLEVLHKTAYDLDTWEVKQEELEEIYVRLFKSAYTADFSPNDLYTECPTGKATHKLIPVDEEPKFYSYKLTHVDKEGNDIEKSPLPKFMPPHKPREYTGTTIMVKNAMMGGEAKITLSVDGAIRETCGSKFKLIPVDECEEIKGITRATSSYISPSSHDAYQKGRKNMWEEFKKNLEQISSANIKNSILVSILNVIMKLKPE